MSDHQHYRTGPYGPALMAYTTPKGIRAVVLRLGADPTDTHDWIENARRFYESEKRWRREMMGDWSTPAGDPYFPIFSSIGKDHYVYMMRALIQGPVFRSFDFGRRRPACTWFQYSRKSDRIWLIREFMPQELQTHEFRDAVRFLSGQITQDAVPERAWHWIQAYAARPSGGHCPPPWFPLGTRFIDIGGKELLQGGASAVMPELSTAKDIFAAVDMHLIAVNPRVEGRNRLVDRMLMMRPDSFPGTLIDPQCEEMIAGFEGAFAYPMPTPGNPIPTLPKDDGHYINLLDAYGYGVAAVVDPDAPPAAQPAVLVGYKDNGRTPIYRALEPDVEIMPGLGRRR